MSRLSLALLHYPVVDRNDKLYTTAITNIDVHDIARSSCTFGLQQYYLISPITAQQKLANSIKDFWVDGTGHRKNADRARALSLISVHANIEKAIAHETEIAGQKPTIIATSAKIFDRNTINYQRGRAIITESNNTMLLFGTGYGLAPQLLDQADYLLDPIYGADDYNHLSVRSAVAIILDRLCGR